MGKYKGFGSALKILAIGVLTAGWTPETVLAERGSEKGFGNLTNSKPQQTTLHDRTEAARESLLRSGDILLLEINKLADQVELPSANWSDARRATTRFLSDLTSYNVEDLADQYDRFDSDEAWASVKRSLSEWTTTAANTAQNLDTGSAANFEKGLRDLVFGEKASRNSLLNTSESLKRYLEALRNFR